MAIFNFRNKMADVISDRIPKIQAMYAHTDVVMVKASALLSSHPANMGSDKV